ncbi:MAG: N-acetyl-gamma-glutamyl-phosphate reductase [Verrucomicrobia bacterium]|nr:N-acetyl-gamma-glutamyl-phosphate reductase [Verrucomicrobiota bacterium]
MLKAKIVGAGGYGGVGIAELLLGHPDVSIQTLVALDNAGKAMSAVYPHLTGALDMMILSPDDPTAAAPADVVFMATPDAVGMNLAGAELARGAKIIDYSGDFRFQTAEGYAAYATRIGINPTHAAPSLLSQSVYGLTELHRDKITTETAIVGNPGCFAVSCTLGLAPAVKAGLIELDTIICDCKTGISGAGRKVNASFHYPERYENMNAYKLLGHQHVCEIETELGLLAGRPVQVTFTSQVVPLCRGIMSSLYAKLSPAVDQRTVLAAYRDFFEAEPFVFVYDQSVAMGTVHVRGTNRANLVVACDERTGTFRVISYIDNLMKGQAGSALQNMNRLFGFPETVGLDRPGQYP